MTNRVIGRLGAEVGVQVRRRREQRGITAAELARRAGVSKAALSIIENGLGNPTLDTLDALAVALRLPLTDLLRTDRPREVTHRAASDWDGREVHRELLHRGGKAKTTETWRLRMPPDTVLRGVPHSAGTDELLIVTSGTLEAGPDGEMVRLAAGEALSFPGDQPHGYRTSTDAADVTVLLSSPAD